MQYRSCLIKPVSAECDLACAYCFYRHTATSRRCHLARMTDETAEYLIAKFMATNVLPLSITFSFQGGEPTLAGLRFFRNFVAMVERLRTPQHQVQYVIQTNGMALTDEWCEFFQAHNFLVGVSLDGFAKLHDAFRRDYSGRGSFLKVMESIRLLRHHEVSFNILTVLTRNSAEFAGELYDFYRSEAFRYVQLIPCLAAGTDGADNRYSMTPKCFANFYKTFYQCWLEDYQRGNFINIALFEQLLAILQGGLPWQCGMLGFCSPQYVIESNGDVYPCDFYADDINCCGNINIDDLKKLQVSPTLRRFLQDTKSLPPPCQSCRFIGICRGGCKRQRMTYLTQNYCAYSEFLDFACDSLRRIADNRSGDRKGY